MPDAVEFCVDVCVSLSSTPFIVYNAHVFVDLCNIVLCMFTLNIYIYTECYFLVFRDICINTFTINRHQYYGKMPIGYNTLHAVARIRKNERDGEKGKGKEIKRNEQIKMKSTINKSMKHDMPSTNMLGIHTRSLSFFHSLPTRFTLAITKNIVSRMCVCSYKYMCMGSNNSNIICRYTMLVLYSLLAYTDTTEKRHVKRVKKQHTTNKIETKRAQLRH